MAWSQADVKTVQGVLDLLSGRWVLRMVRALAEGPQRPRDLRAAVGEVSSQVFYDTMNRLDRQGVIHRDIRSSQAGVYVLTPLGRTVALYVEQLMLQMTNVADRPGAGEPHTASQAATDTLRVLAGKWVLPIMVVINESAARPSTISDSVKQITGTTMSDKAMHATLHRLIANGLITRARIDGAPPISEYGMTDLGRAALGSAHLFTGLDSTSAHPEGNPHGISTELDPTVPSSARMYDYYLGGKNNLAVDREAAERIFSIDPNVPAVAQANRRFLVRAVRYIAEQGVRQFIDLGTGIPTPPNVHETADDVAPGNRVVYVDNDPVVMAHSRVLLETRDDVVAVNTDIRWPNKILGHPAVRQLIDFDRPVAVLLVSVLHFFDDADAERIVHGFRSRLVPGSFLTISAATSDGIDGTEQRTAEEVYARAHTRAVARSGEEIGRFFAGCELVEPGIVRVERWHAAEPATRASLIGGVGRVLG